MCRASDGKCSHLPLLGAPTSFLGARGLHFQSHDDKVENTDIKNYWKKDIGNKKWLEIVKYFLKV